MPESKFVVETRPVYEKLVDLWDEFSKADISDPELALELIAGLEQAERNVLLTWAESTVDVNPTMLDDVNSGRVVWCPSLNDHLSKVLYPNEDGELNAR